MNLILVHLLSFPSTCNICEEVIKNVGCYKNTEEILSNENSQLIHIHACSEVCLNIAILQHNK